MTIAGINVFAHFVQVVKKINNRPTSNNSNGSSSVL